MKSFGSRKMNKNALMHMCTGTQCLWGSKRSLRIKESAIITLIYLLGSSGSHDRMPGAS